MTVAAAFAAATIVAASLSHIHGQIVSIDRQHGTFLIHHDPFPKMPMSMTMEAQPKDPADLKKLHVGEYIDATIDTSIDPWPVTDIRPVPLPKKRG